MKRSQLYKNTSLVPLHLTEKIFRLLLKISVQRSNYEYHIIFGVPSKERDKNYYGMGGKEALIACLHMLTYVRHFVNEHEDVHSKDIQQQKNNSDCLCSGAGHRSKIGVTPIFQGRNTRVIGISFQPAINAPQQSFIGHVIASAQS